MKEHAMTATTLPKLPDVQPFLDKCGHGTGWYGDMIRAQLIAAMAQAAREQRERDLELVMDEMPKNERSDWTEYAEIRAKTLTDCYEAIFAQPDPRKPK